MRYLVLLFLTFNLSCTSLSKMVKNLAGTKQVAKKERVGSMPKDTFNANKNFKAASLPNRKYGRMNQKRFEQEAKVNEEAGSLWVDEGQSSYLFSQNQNRLEGDVLNIFLENQAKDQLDNKVATIAKLLKERKEIARKRQEARKRQLASKNQAKEAQASNEAPKESAKAEQQKDSKLSVDKVPSRIVASYPDGSYRVKGTKTILIEDKEFQVMITGLARGNDIKDDGVASSKLLDAKFDIVSSRRMR